VAAIKVIKLVAAATSSHNPVLKKLGILARRAAMLCLRYRG